MNETNYCWNKNFFLNLSILKYFAINCYNKYFFKNCFLHRNSPFESKNAILSSTLEFPAIYETA